MGDAVGGLNGELKCGGVCDAGTVEVGRLNALFTGESLDLFGCAVHDGDADVQGTQQCEVEEEVGEVFVGDNAAVDCEDEDLFAELGDVLEDSAEVGELHV